MKLSGVAIAMALLFCPGCTDSLRTGSVSQATSPQMAPRNSQWTAYYWVSAIHPYGEIEPLLDSLWHHNVNQLYLNVGSFTPKGVIAAPPGLEPFLNAVQKYENLHAPGSVHFIILAWVNKGASNKLRIADADVRMKMASSMGDLLSSNRRLDGIHLDYEPASGGDKKYLDLLEETKRDIGPSKRLSVATPTLTASNTKFTWSSRYYRSVGAQVDEVAVMAYDTHIAEPKLYALFVQREVDAIAKALRARADLVIGLPAYKDATPSHNPAVENVTNALKGIRKIKRASKIAGIALYPDCKDGGMPELSAGQWDAYNQLKGR